eukprot:Pgem_evm2s18566
MSTFGNVVCLGVNVMFCFLCFEKNRTLHYSSVLEMDNSQALTTENSEIKKLKKAIII